MKFYDGKSYAPEQSIGHLMKRIMLLMQRHVERRLAAHDLTSAQWVPLWLVSLGQADTAQALTAAVNMDAGAMTRLLDRLEAKGLLERERSQDDRRVVRLKLTDAGRDVVRHIPGVLAEVNNEALAGFTKDEFKVLIAMLTRMHATLLAAEESA